MALKQKFQIREALASSINRIWFDENRKYYTRECGIGLRFSCTSSFTFHHWRACVSGYGDMVVATQTCM
jgi:hypothetical protein